MEPTYLDDTPAIELPVELTDDSIVRVQWRTFLMLCQAFVAEHHRAPDDVLLADWGLSLARSIVTMGGE